MNQHWPSGENKAKPNSDQTLDEHTKLSKNPEYIQIEHFENIPFLELPYCEYRNDGGDVIKFLMDTGSNKNLEGHKFAQIFFS